MKQPTALVAASLFLTIPSQAADWPQYLGPNGDNSTPETIRTNWSSNPPRELWRKPIGAGFSCLAVSGDRGFTVERKTVNGAEREVCVSLDLETGTEVWAINLDAADYSNLSEYDDRMDGPRSTPTVEGDRVYVSTSQLKLFCLQVSDGTIVWQRDFRKELQSDLIPWENAASPLLAGDLIYVNSNAPGHCLMAVHKFDGTTAWSVRDDGLTHATPVFGRIGDVSQVIFLTASGLVAVHPETGALLWRTQFAPSSTSTAASPLVVGNYVWASAAYSFGTWVAQVTKTAEGLSASKAWSQQGNAYQSHWSTPVQVNGYLYGVPSSSSAVARLACLNVASGTNSWTQTQVGSSRIGFGSIIKAANTLIVLTEAGELVLVDPNPDVYSEVAKFKVLDLYCWNHPTLANGRLYARSTSTAPELVALDVAADPPPALPPLALEVGRTVTAGSIQLIVRAADSTNLDPGGAARLELLSAVDLSMPSEQWTLLNQTFTATNGTWVTEVGLDNESYRWLQVRVRAESTASGIAQEAGALPGWFLPSNPQEER